MPEKSQHRLVPLANRRSPESELALVGLFLDRPSLFPEIRRRLGDGECLRDLRHRTIYLTARDLDDQGLAPDFRTVIDRLRAIGHLEKAGGADYISEILGEGLPSLCGQYCDSIWEEHLRDTILRKLSSAQQRITNGEGLEHVLNDLLTEIAEAQSHGPIYRGYETRSASEIVASAGDLEWCVESLLPANGLGIISGDSGIGKTWMVLDLSHAVVSGKPWLSCLPCRQGPALFIDEESGERLLADRLRLLGVSDSDMAKMHIVSFERVKLDTLEGQERLRGTIIRCDPALVVIDSLTKVHARDENSASDMKRITGPLAQIARTTNCGIVLVHHSGKKHGDDHLAERSLRGSSELKAAPDLHLSVTRVGKHRLRIRHEKSRFGPTIRDIEIALRTSNGILRLGPAEEPRTEEGRAERLIIESIKAGDGSISRQRLLSIGATAKIKERTLDGALGILTDRGVLTRDTWTERSSKGKGNWGRLYRLSPELEDLTTTEILQRLRTGHQRMEQVERRLLE